MDLGALVADRLTRVAESAGLVVLVESNVSPTFTLYDARDSAPSLLDALGVQVHVIAKTADGHTIAEYGEPVAFDPIRALAFAALLVLAVTVVGAALARALR